MASSSSEFDPTAADDLYRTPLGDRDTEQIAVFWRRFLQATDRNPDLPVPLAFGFGDSVELVDELFELVAAGTKRATAGSLAEMAADDEPLPRVGDLSIVLDGSMEPRLVIETTDVRVGPLSSVDDQFAWDEGEGDRSRNYWLTAHRWYFQRAFKRLGLEFNDNIEVAFERFEVIYRDG